MGSEMGSRLDIGQIVTTRTLFMTSGNPGYPRYIVGWAKRSVPIFNPEYLAFRTSDVITITMMMYPHFEAFSFGIHPMGTLMLCPSYRERHYGAFGLFPGFCFGFVKYQVDHYSWNGVGGIMSDVWV